MEFSRKMTMQNLRIFDPPTRGFLDMQAPDSSQEQSSSPKHYVLTVLESGGPRVWNDRISSRAGASAAFGMIARNANGSLSTCGGGNDSLPSFAPTAQMAQLVEVGRGVLELSCELFRLV